MGFINLFALGYVSLIGLVVLIYVFNKKKVVVQVPSMIPWDILKEDVVKSRIFRVDMLFLLQILLILLLAFFLARPYLKSNIIKVDGKNIILIIDSSASMQTTEDGGSRFDQARSQAHEMVTAMKPWDKMMVISSDYSASIASDFTDDKQKLTRTINALAPKDTGTNLDEGISLGISLLKNVARGELYVLTDLAPSSISVTQMKSGNIKFLRYGKNSDNVAISSLDVYQDMFKDYTEREAYVTLKNYSDRNKSVRLRVFLNEEIIIEDEIELQDEEQKTLSVSGINSSGILKAVIETDDFLFVDNSAYAVINEIKPINILLVSDDYKLKDELIKIEHGTQRINLTKIRVSEYEQEDVKDYDVAVFHKFIPDYDPGINSLYVMPHLPVKNPQRNDVKGREYISDVLIRGQRLVREVKILDWDNTHSTMTHLHNLHDLNIASAFVMMPPDWAVPLIKIADNEKDSPIAYAGRYAGKKIVTLGFDLSDFDFSRSDDLRILIMTLNIIQWLNPYEEEGRFQTLTGKQYTVDYVPEDHIEIQIPRGKILKYDFEDNVNGHFVFNKIEHTGEYKITGNNYKKRFVANLFDEEESRIMPEPAVVGEFEFEEIEAQTLIKDKKSEFGNYLLWLVPFILFIEWLLYYKKVRAGTV